MMITKRTLLSCCVAIAAILPFAPAQAQNMPDLSACERLAVDPDAVSSRTMAPTLPREWTGIARSSRNWLAITTNIGATHCSYLGWYDEIETPERLGGRFLGFAWTGLEAWGYILIDPTGTGQVADTGARPHFSPRGRRFATVQWSDAGWGGFEGFAVYDIRRTDFVPVHVDTKLEYFADWRIDQWEGEDCVHLSAVPYERIDSNWENLPAAARDPYVAGAATGWRLTVGDICPTYDAG
jgi:hypothetical protein